MRYMQVVRGAIVIIGLLAANFFALSGVRAAPPAKDICSLTHAAVIVSKNVVSTTSQVFSDLAGSDIRIVQGGNHADCVVLSFSAEAEVFGANDLMLLQAVVDGVTICEPGAVFFVRSGTSAAFMASRSVNFVCSGVTPGSHRIKLQYRSGNGATVSLQFRTLTVHHAR